MGIVVQIHLRACLFIHLLWYYCRPHHLVLATKATFRASDAAVIRDLLAEWPRGPS